MAKPKRQLLDILRERESSMMEGESPSDSAVSGSQRGRQSAPNWGAVFRPFFLVVAVAAFIWLCFLVWGWVQGLKSAEPTPAEPPRIEAEYGVRVITYGATMLGLAKDVAREMNSRDFPELQLLDEGGQYVIYTGKELDPTDLAGLLEKVQRTSLNGKPGEFPFSSAMIDKWPNYKSPTQSQ